MSDLENKIEILKELELDEDGEVIYKDAFMISEEDLIELITMDIEGFDDLDEFLENYDPSTDGFEVYEVAKRKGMEITDCIEDNINEENDGLNNEDFDPSEFDSLDDLDFDDDEEDLFD